MHHALLLPIAAILLGLTGCTATDGAAHGAESPKRTDASAPGPDAGAGADDTTLRLTVAPGGIGIPGLTVRLTPVKAGSLKEGPPTDPGTVFVADRDGFVRIEGLPAGTYGVVLEAGVDPAYETRKFEGRGHTREPFEPTHLGTLVIPRPPRDVMEISVGNADGPAPLYVVCSVLDRAGEPIPILPTDVHASAIVQTEEEPAIPPRIVGPINVAEGRRRIRADAWVLRLDGRFPQFVDVEGSDSPRLDVKRIDVHPDGGVLDVRINPAEPGPLGQVHIEARGAMAWVVLRHDASGMSRWTGSAAGSAADGTDQDPAGSEITPGEVTLSVLSLLQSEGERAIQPYHELGEEAATLHFTVRAGETHRVSIDSKGRPSLTSD